MIQRKELEALDWMDLVDKAIDMDKRIDELLSAKNSVQLQEQAIFTQALKAQDECAKLRQELQEVKHQNWMLQAKLITAEGISEMRKMTIDFYKREIQGKVAP